MPYQILITKKELGGSPGLEVMGRDSHSEGCGFESRHRILDGHFFTYCKNCNVCLKKTENKQKRGRGWPIFKKKRKKNYYLFYLWFFSSKYTLHICISSLILPSLLQSIEYLTNLLLLSLVQICASVLRHEPHNLRSFSLSLSLSFFLSFFLSVWFLKNGTSPASFPVYFRSVQTNITIFTTNKCAKNVHPVHGAGIWTHDLWNMSLLP